jgi:hypothetical protein
MNYELLIMNANANYELLIMNAKSRMLMINYLRKLLPIHNSSFIFII